MPRNHGPQGGRGQTRYPVGIPRSPDPPRRSDVEPRGEYAARLRRSKSGLAGNYRQDLSDILVYLRNLPATRQLGARLETGSSENGRALFESKGCVQCHTGKLALAPRLKGKTLTDIAVDMWDHAPKMAQPPAHLELGEMRQIVSYLWAEAILQDSGSQADGKKVFTAKNCA